MNKNDLAKKIAADHGLTQKQAAEILENVFSTIADSVAKDEDVSIYGFGVFSLKHRDARQGRNPATGEAMEFAASNTPVFKPAKAFKTKVN